MEYSEKIGNNLLVHTKLMTFIQEITAVSAEKNVHGKNKRDRYTVNFATVGRDSYPIIIFLFSLPKTAVAV